MARRILLLAFNFAGSWLANHRAPGIEQTPQREGRWRAGPSRRRPRLQQQEDGRTHRVSIECNSQPFGFLGEGHVDERERA